MFTTNVALAIVLVLLCFELCEFGRDVIAAAAAAAAHDAVMMKRSSRHLGYSLLLLSMQHRTAAKRL